MPCGVQGEEAVPWRHRQRARREVRWPAIGERESIAPSASVGGLGRGWVQSLSIGRPRRLFVARAKTVAPIPLPTFPSKGEGLNRARLFPPLQGEGWGGDGCNRSRSGDPDACSWREPKPLHPSPSRPFPRGGGCTERGLLPPLREPAPDSILRAGLRRTRIVALDAALSDAADTRPPRPDVAPELGATPGGERQRSVTLPLTCVGVMKISSSVFAVLLVVLRNR